MNRKIYKIIILVFAILSLNNIILLIRNYSYAYFEKNIKTGVKLKITTLDKMPVKGTPGIDALKDTLGKTGGIIGVTNDNQKVTTENGNIREYRYSGLNANNYVKLNNNGADELWRIIGIFKDTDNDEWYIKIVRNEVLPMSYIPTNYVINGTTYKIKANGNNGYTTYWNYITGNQSKDKNDWATGGLQYWLNTEKDNGSNKGYMSYLSEETKSMLQDRKHYLGTTKDGTPDDDATVASIIQEIIQAHQDVGFGVEIVQLGTEK